MRFFHGQQVKESLEQNIPSKAEGFRKIDLFFCFLFLLLFTAFLLPSLLTFSETHDEGWLLKAARKTVLHHNWDEYDSLRHPPLTFLTYARLLSDKVDDRQNLLRARLAMVLYPLVLGVLLYGYALKHLGRSAAVAALALWSTNPTLLAHASLITTDLCAACTFFLAFITGASAIRTPSFWRILLAGACLGIALLAKYTGVLMIPVLLLMALLPVRARVEKIGKVRQGEGSNIFIPGKIKEKTPGLLRRLGCCMILFSVALLVLNLPYGFEEILSSPYEARSRLLTSLFPDTFVLPLIPEPYLIGFDRVQEVMELGHPAYFLGEFTLKNRWYFYVFAFLWKEPLPFLFLLGAGLFFVFFRKPKVRILFLPMVIPGFSFLFLNNNFVGLRHLLVIYPFLFLIASLPFVDIRNKKHRLLWVLPVLQVLSTLFVAPHYLAYFNEAVGGAKAGSHYLLDSNLDWGQDFDEIQQRKARSLRLIKTEPGPLPTLGLVAVSANDLRGYPGTWPGPAWLLPFSSRESVGYTWQIYDLSLRDFEEAAKKDPNFRIHLGWVYQERGKEEEALRVFREEGDRVGQAILLLDRGRIQAAWEACREKGGAEEAKDEHYFQTCALILQEGGESRLAERYLRHAVAAAIERSYLGVRPSLDKDNYIGRHDAKALNNLGYLVWREGDLEEAGSLFRQATEQDPLFADPWGNLAALSAQLAEIALLSGFRTPRINQPRILRIQGETPEEKPMDLAQPRAYAAAALDFRSRYLQLRSSARAWWAKRVSYKGHEAVYPDIFVLPLPYPFALEGIAQGKPMSLEGRENLGVSYLLGKDSIRALRAFRSVLKENPDKARSLYHVGIIYFRSRLYEKARKNLKRALALKPEYIEAKEALSYLERYLAP